MRGPNKVIRYQSNIPLNELSPDVVMLNNGSVRINCRVPNCVMRVKPSPMQLDEFAFYVQSGYAERYARALQHLIELKGGRREAF
jgi:hypothetical protein